MEHLDNEYRCDRGAADGIDVPAMAAPSQPDSVRRLLFFVLPIGFVAFLTFDAAYTKLGGKDVSQAETLAAITTGLKT